MYRQSVVPLRWRPREDVPEQVLNADEPTVDLTPASSVPGDAVKAAWAPLLSGQVVPLIWER